MLELIYFVFLLLLGIYLVKSIQKFIITKIGVDINELIKKSYKNKEISSKRIHLMTEDDLEIIENFIQQYYYNFKSDSIEEASKKLLIKRKNYLFREKNGHYGSLKSFFDLLINATLIGIMANEFVDAFEYIVEWILNLFYKVWGDIPDISQIQPITLIIIFALALLIIMIKIALLGLIIVTTIIWFMNLVFGKSASKNNYDLYDYELNLIDKILSCKRTKEKNDIYLKELYEIKEKLKVLEQQTKNFQKENV